MARVHEAENAVLGDCKKRRHESRFGRRRPERLRKLRCERVEARAARREEAPQGAEEPGHQEGGGHPLARDVRDRHEDGVVRQHNDVPRVAADAERLPALGDRGEGRALEAARGQERSLHLARDREVVLEALGARRRLALERSVERPDEPREEDEEEELGAVVPERDQRVRVVPLRDEVVHDEDGDARERDGEPFARPEIPRGEEDRQKVEREERDVRARDEVDGGEKDEQRRDDAGPETRASSARGGGRG